MASSAFAKMLAAQTAQQKNELALSDDFELELCKYVSEKSKARAARASAALKPSQFKACVRMLWYYRRLPEAMDAMDAQGAVDVDLQMQAEVGTAFHEVFHEIMADMTAKDYRIKKVDVEKWVATLPKRGIRTEVAGKLGHEWKLRNNDYDVPVSFLLDDLIEFRDRIWLWDLKSTDQRTLGSLLEMRRKDKEQLGGYTLLAGVPNLWVTYVARDTGKRRHFQWAPNEEERAEIAGRIKSQAAAVLSDELPMYERDRCKASYCPFHRQCKQDGGEPA